MGEYISREECLEIRHSQDKMQRALGTITRGIITAAWGLVLIIAVASIRFTMHASERLILLEERVQNHDVQMAAIHVAIKSMEMDIQAYKYDTHQVIRDEMSKLSAKIDARNAK